MRHGRGVYKYVGEVEYEGEWVKDIKHGRGRMKDSDGVMIEGTWKNDRLNGLACWGEEGQPVKTVIYKDDMLIDRSIGI